MQLDSPGLIKVLPSRGEAFQGGLKASAGSLDDLQWELPKLHIHVLLLHFL